MQTSGRNNTSRLIKIAVAFVMGVLIVIVALQLLAPPPSGRIFTGIGTAWCMYNVKVIAFADNNRDGLQSLDEPGIPAVTVSLQHSVPEKGTPERISTDANGLASLNRDTYCLSNDMLMVNAVAPSGYSATTPLSFGPYPAPRYTPDSLTQAAQNPIPEVIYIGLHKS